jgi:hypothetical protein
MSYSEMPQNQPNPRESTPLNLQIVDALVDGSAWVGNFNQQTVDKLSLEVLTSGSENDIAARIGFLAGLKILGGETHGDKAVLRVNINGKNFIARYTIQNAWRGMWETPELIEEVIDKIGEK